MLLLAFDTAGPDCAAALVRGDGDGARIVVQRSERIGRGHAEALMPMVEEVLGVARASFADLDKIAVTTGPGSFTGVRVGVAAARSLALALNIPAVGVGTLQALAMSAARSRSHGTAVAALDAKRGELYVYAQEIPSGAILVPAAALPAASAGGVLRGLPSPLLLSGSAAPLLADALGPDSVVVNTAESPDIAEVARLGLRLVPGSPPVPLYLRGADAKPQAEKTVALL